jgi:hypothetical protein
MYPCSLRIGSQDLTRKDPELATFCDPLQSQQREQRDMKRSRRRKSVVCSSSPRPYHNIPSSLSQPQPAPHAVFSTHSLYSIKPSTSLQTEQVQICNDGTSTDSVAAIPRPRPRGPQKQAENTRSLACAALPTDRGCESK